MSTKMLVTMRLDQRMAMSQQLTQAISLLQYNTLDLKQLVQQYMEKNPLLELEENESAEEVNEQNDDDSEDYDSQTNFSEKMSSRKSNYEDESVLENYSTPESLRDHLLNQTLLCQFNDDEQIIATAIIDAIDDDGYLTMTLEDIQKTTEKFYNLTLIENVLKIIQGFDPIGVGSRDIRECLLIQLDNFIHRDQSWSTAYKIIHDHFDIVSTHSAKKDLQKLGIAGTDYANAMKLIRTLNPHPGSEYSSETNVNLEPELHVKKIKDVWCVNLSESILTNIRVNLKYQELIKKYKKHKSYEALKQELEEAKWLINGLRRRNETLLAVGEYIVKFQTDFFEHGESHLKSMNIVDVAQALELHESTISRITTGKCIATHRGVYELKYFFPSSVTTKTGETCSATAIKTFIKDIIHSETDKHIYSDEEIANILREKGINIARRTVAKYREAMRILSSYQRQMQHADSAADLEVEVG